jgi:hypothetical protein
MEVHSDMYFITLIHSQQVMCRTTEFYWHTGILQISNKNNTFTLGYPAEEEIKALAYFKESTINKYFDAAESLRTQYFLSHSIQSSHLTEPESPSLYLQKPIKCPSPKPDES